MLSQIVDIDITRVLTEYQAQILADEQENRFVADSPDGVNLSVQYRNGVKAHAVYLYHYQPLPYKRIEKYFTDQLVISINSDTLVRFKQQAAELLEQTEAIDKIIRPLQVRPYYMSTKHVSTSVVNASGFTVSQPHGGQPFTLTQNEANRQ